MSVYVPGADGVPTLSVTFADAPGSTFAASGVRVPSQITVLPAESLQ